MAATSDVTVLLPFEPVIATTGASAARANSSMSPTIGTPRAAAARSAGSRTDTPGLTTISAAVSNTGASKPPHRISTSGNSDSTAARHGGCSRESTATILRPGSPAPSGRPGPARWRTHESPVAPSPTTSTCPAGHGARASPARPVSMV